MQLNYKYKQSKHAGVMAFKYGTHENEICKWAVDFTKEHKKTCLIRCFDHSRNCCIHFRIMGDNFW